MQTQAKHAGDCYQLALIDDGDLLLIEKLSVHRGAANAIMAPDLAEWLYGDRDDRKVRERISHLRNQGVLIGSSSSKPAGYYMVETWPEFLDTVGSIRGRAMSMLTIVTNMYRKAQAKFGEQAVLSLMRVDAAVDELRKLEVEDGETSKDLGRDRGDDLGGVADGVPRR